MGGAVALILKQRKLKLGTSSRWLALALQGTLPTSICVSAPSGASLARAMEEPTWVLNARQPQSCLRRMKTVPYENVICHKAVAPPELPPA